MVSTGDTEMKRYEWEFPVVPERLQLQLRQIAPEVRQDRQSAIRGALLDGSQISEPWADDEQAGAAHTERLSIPGWSATKGARRLM